MFGNRPPISIKEDNDKTDPMKLAPRNESWRWIIALIVTGAILLIVFYWAMMRRFDYVIQNTNSEFERNFNILASNLMPFIFIGLIIAAAVAIINYIRAKTNKEKLVNIYEHQSTYDTLNGAANLMRELGGLRLEIEKIRADRITLPSSVLSVQDSHDTSSSSKETNANIDATKASEVASADLSIQTLLKKGFIKEVTEK